VVFSTPQSKKKHTLEQKNTFEWKPLIVPQTTKHSPLTILPTFKCIFFSPIGLHQEKNTRYIQDKEKSLGHPHIQIQFAHSLICNTGWPKKRVPFTTSKWHRFVCQRGSFVFLKRSKILFFDRVTSLWSCKWCPFFLGHPV